MTLRILGSGIPELLVGKTVETVEKGLREIGVADGW